MTSKPGYEAFERRILELEARLGDYRKRFRRISGNISEFIFEHDLSGNFTEVIPHHTDWLGLSRDEIVGRNARDLMPRRFRRQFDDYLKRVIVSVKDEGLFQVFSRDGSAHIIEYWNILVTDEAGAQSIQGIARDVTERLKSMEWELMKSDGTRIFVDASASLKKGLKGGPIGFQGIIRDVTERKRFEQELAYPAYHDSLTGLYNRKAFLEKLTETVMEARRYETGRAILYLDLDSIKKVNDLHGHEIGDRLLVEVAARLRGTLRKGDYISRLGGDEFTVILASSKALHAEGVAGRIIQRLSRPYSILGVTIDFISASVGVSVFPQDGHDARTLLKHADEAMYRAKI
ncbi:MAG TPA: sensor domain-containing diguanylate cyclase, partial [Deltaproteobacteria bacterium]|nr:sensor domain-containing diguanylate cyclase [Deltaproteobacteria bacterium]